MVSVFFMQKNRFRLIYMQLLTQVSTNITDMESDRVFKPYIPPIVPKGIFKTALHFHNNNKTLIDVEVISEIRQIGLSDSINLGWRVTWCEHRGLWRSHCQIHVCNFTYIVNPITSISIKLLSVAHVGHMKQIEKGKKQSNNISWLCFIIKWCFIIYLSYHIKMK